MRLPLLFVLAATATAVEHPFILWTADEAAAIRERIGSEDWARAAWEGMDRSGRHDGFGRMFAASVMGDEEARAAVVEEVLSFAGAPVDRRPWSSNYLSALRYDCVHEHLDAEQRERVEATFRVHIDHEIERDGRRYTRTSWLPNMQWPRKMGAYLMAAAIGDEARMRALFAANGGWKYYFDDYLADGRFYNEEFGKQYSTMGTMLLWCRACERLGLDELGYGYVGEDGATMRRYLRSYLEQGFPRVELGTGRAHYPRVTMGDAKGKGLRGVGYGFQHALVTGYRTDGVGGNDRWMGSNMNGRDHENRVVRKMLFPLWFEIGHARWPEDGYGYFLAAMRGPDQERYVPSLYFGCEPIAPGDVEPPEAASGAHVERGFAVLRAESGHGFWESPAPAVAVRWTTPYVHHVADDFSLLGLHAFNRPLYVNRQVSAGYAGTDHGWSNSIRSHSGVMVDDRDPRSAGEIPLRSSFGERAQFVAGTAEGVYPDVTQTRALVLTRDYLVDVFHLASPYPRSYLWMVHALGHACGDRPGEWVDTQRLVGSIPALAGERSRSVGGEDWAITVHQVGAGADPRFTPLGEAWFARRPGVRLTMLGAPGTTAYTGWGPAMAGDVYRLRHGNPEPGGRVIAAGRGARETAFVAVHEPFLAVPRCDRVERLGQSGAAVAVRVRGEDVDDRIAVAWAEPDAVQVLADEFTGESIAFRGYGFVRIAADRIAIEGDVVGFRLRVPGDVAPPVGDASTRREGPFVVFGAAELPAASAETAVPAAARGPLAARWSREELRVATGGVAEIELHLRNFGFAPRDDELRIVAGAGLEVEPATFELDGLEAGGERTVAVRVAADAVVTGRASHLRLAGERVQPARLRVVQGLLAEPRQRWPGRPAVVVSGPRFRATHHRFESIGALLLLDGDGERRTFPRRRGRTILPRLLVAADDGRGWDARRIGGFRYWGARRRGGDGDAPPTLVASGTHPHSATDAPLFFRWTEDWILVGQRPVDEGRYRLEWFATPDRGGDDVPERLRELLLLHDGEAIATVDPRRPGDARPIRAAFRRPRGYRFGEAQFFSDGARFEGVERKRRTPIVSQEGRGQSAFTYCTAEEFAELAEHWLAHGADAAPRRWGQGDMDFDR